MEVRERTKACLFKNGNFEPFHAMIGAMVMTMKRGSQDFFSFYFLSLPRKKECASTRMIG